MCATLGAVPLILIDDGGELRRYRNEDELLRSPERPESTRCIIDPAGQYHHLHADHDGHLLLGRAIGQVEHHTLLDIFLRRQHTHPQDHRLLRRHPRTPEESLVSIFEELEIEDTADHQTWTVESGHQTWQCAGLAAVDDRVTQSQGPSVVTDPFGHHYRPHSPNHSILARRLKGRPLYVEISRERARA